VAKKPRQASNIVVAAWCVTLLTLPVAAQEGFREQVSINDSGQVLQFPEQGGVEGEPSAQRVTGGVATVLIETTDSVASTTVEGLGARAQLNNSGVSAIKVSFQDDSTNTPCTTATCNDGAIVRVDGASTSILALARNNGTGTAVGSHTVCAVSPMPRINNNGQAAFHAFLDIGGDAHTPLDCSSNSTQETNTDFGREHSAILRHSGGTLSSLIQGRINGGASTLFVPGSSPFVASDTTFQVTEVTLNAEGSERFNGSGVALIDAWLETQAGIDTDGADALACNGGTLDHRCAERDDRHALLLVDGTTTTLVAMTGVSGDSPYQVLAGGMLSSTGQVVFKADRGTSPSGCGLKGHGCTQTGHELVLFSGGVRTTIVETGDDVPSSSDPNVIFCDFSPYVAFAGGDIAFQAKVATDGACNLSGSAEQGDGIFLYSGGTITEIARDTTLTTNDAGSTGPFTSSFEGVDFDQLGGGLALSGGSVFFLAEDLDFDDPAGCPVDSFSDNELSAIIAFTPGSGLETILREGDLLPNGDRILRMYSDPNVLNEQTNTSAQLVMVMDTDADSDCAFEEGEPTIAAIAGSIISAPLAVPSATAIGLTLMVLLLSATAVWWLRNPTAA
jgi:hypothetical protein